jgi:hypothetical protein
MGNCLNQRVFWSIMLLILQAASGGAQAMILSLVLPVCANDARARMKNK